MYNLLCRIPELEVLPAAQEFGIGVIPYMPLAGGLLTGKLRSEEGSRTNQVENEYGISLGEQNKQITEFSASAARSARRNQSSPSPGLWHTRP